LYHIECNSSKYKDINYDLLSPWYPFVSGELGLWCSNLALWQDALSNNYKRIVVFQDDIKILNTEKFNDQLNNFISHLPTTFDIAFIDMAMESAKARRVNEYVSKFEDGGYAYGAWAVVYSEKALRKMPNFAPYRDNDDMIFFRYRAHENDKTTDFNFEVYISAIDMVDVVGGSEMDRIY